MGGYPVPLRPPHDVNRFNRWRKASVWDRPLDGVSEAYDGDIQIIDSSSIRVHQHAANGRGIFSPRERDIHVQLNEGKSNKLIAHSLDMAEPTGNFHLRNIYANLGVNN